MQQDSIIQQIFERIEKGNRDSVYIAMDFLDLGEYHAVRQALLRLEKSGKIQKIMRGVYYYPRYSELIGEYEAPLHARLQRLSPASSTGRLLPAETLH